MTTLVLNPSPEASLILPVLLRPIFSQLEDLGGYSCGTLSSAFTKAESSCPGVSYEFLMGLVKKSGVQIDLNESLLKLQGSISEKENGEYKLSRTEEPFQELNRRSIALKRILGKIPDEITNRKAFLEAIKEIASAIKKLLDSVNDISGYIPGTTGKHALEQRKREFVKYSKRFSNTLKEFFRDREPGPVFASAIRLICQTNQVVLTIKRHCE